MIPAQPSLVMLDEAERLTAQAKADREFASKRLDEETRRYWYAEAQAAQREADVLWARLGGAR